MNPFINPVFLSRILKAYLVDINRPCKITPKKLKNYQDKALKKIVRHAYTVPLYHTKYKEHGVHPNDINGIDDIKKLPFITKDDLRRNYPEGIISKDFDKNDGFLLSTSGSTGKPVFVYLDRFSTIKSLIAFVRVLKLYGAKWNKSRIAIIIDMMPGSIEEAVIASSIYPILKKFINLDNLKYFDIGEKPEVLIKKLNDFNPDYIGSDPNIFRQLAILKNSGLGKNVNPKYAFSSGAMLDQYTRDYVQKEFATKIVDIYSSTEAGPLAFECAEGNYHIQSDFVYIEFLDDKNEPVPLNTPGHTVITKLYGRGTPIIRYVGIDDIVAPIENTCSCGVKTQMIKQMEGRSTDLIILPNGKTFSPLNLTGIPAKTMEYFNSYKIKQFQIIQHKMDQIEILIVIDEKQRNKGVPVKDILRELHRRFSEKIGKDINVTVREVQAIEKDKGSDHVKVVISKIKHN